MAAPVTAPPSQPDLRPLRDFLDRIPGHRRNTKTHLSTAIRWITVGLGSPSGTRIKLRACRFGSRWMTTERWFGEFLNAVAGETQAPNELPAGVNSRPGATVATLELNAILGPACPAE